MSKKVKINKKTGFTLIEVLVSMTIVAVLISISLVSLLGARKVSRDGKRKADLEQIRSALEIYRSECKTYPATITPGNPLTGCGNTYMDIVPSDPLSGYKYYYAGLANSYILCSYLETSSVVQSDCLDCSAGSGNGPCYYKVTNY